MTLFAQHIDCDLSEQECKYYFVLKENMNNVAQFPQEKNQENKERSQLL